MVMDYQTKLKIKYPLIWIFCAGAMLSSCLQGTQYPDEPEIEFISATFKDSIDQLQNNSYLGFITFGFTDGDGDIGVVQNDTTKNMFVIEYGILNGERQTPKDLSYTIPFVTPDGQNKNLKGEIDLDVTILNTAQNPYPYDSVLYEIYIVDRNNNQSNLIITPIIKL